MMFKLLVIFLFLFSAVAKADCPKFYSKSWLEVLVIESFHIPGMFKITKSYCEDLKDKKTFSLKVNCQKATERLEEIKDCHGNPIICYGDEVVELLDSSETREYLRGIVSAAYIARDKGQRLNVWEYTLNHFKDDKRKALKHLGVLFQFTPEMVDMSGKDRAWGITELKDAHAAFKSLYHSGQIELYPKGVDAKRQNIYHFYTVAYSTLRAKEAGMSDEEVLLPFLTNTGYEVVSNSTLDYFSGVPDKLAFEPQSRSSRDTYLGYAGAMFALDKNIVPKKEFDAETSSDFIGFIKTRLK